VSRALIVLYGPREREKAISWIRSAPANCRVEFRHSKRTLPQNAYLWALLSEISSQVEWYGQRLTPEDWKDMLTASLRRYHVVPGIDPGTFVPLGMRTSSMTKQEMADLLELAIAFAAERGVKLGDQKASPAPETVPHG